MTSWRPLPRDLVGPELAAGDVELAARVAAAGLTRDPAAARFAIGRIHLIRGRALEAERAFWAALVAQPTAHGLRGWVATARLMRDDAHGALDALRDGVEVIDDTVAAAARARALAALGRLDEAVAVTAAALGRDANDAGLRLLAARLRFGDGSDATDVAAARAATAAVCADFPALADAQMQQAELAAMTGDIAGADALLSAHLGLANVEPRLAFLLAELRLRTGDHARLFELLPLLGALAAGRADLLTELSALMGELGDADGAVMLLHDAVAADDSAAEPRYRLALLNEARGEDDVALVAYRDVLRRDPRHAGALARVAALTSSAPLSAGPRLAGS